MKFENSSVSILNFILASLFFQLEVCSSQQLSAEYLNTKLPYPAYGQTAFYDGDDKIYLFGSCITPDYQIYVFSISSETLTEIGTLPYSFCFGEAQGDDLGNIFLFGLGYDSNEVFKFTPTLNTTSRVATLPFDLYGATSISYNSTSSTVYLFGGRGELFELRGFDMETATSSILSFIPLTLSPSSVRVNNRAFVFSGAFDNQRAFMLNLDSYAMTQVGPATLPSFNGYGAASVWDGDFIYILGGYSNSGVVPTDGIIQFDPDTFENTFISVSNLPVNSITEFTKPPSSIYVPNKSRIYCFGGRTYNQTRGYVTLEDIFYIDLTSLQSPDAGNICTNSANGMYHHPTDCSRFIGCHKGKMEVFRCPTPLLFDPVTKICGDSELRNCQ